jgi:hypothetical protein
LALNSLLAQLETGTLVGSITDPSEAALPGVQVSIRSVDSGVVFEVSTNGAGRFQSPPVKPGEASRFAA